MTRVPRSAASRTAAASAPALAAHVSVCELTAHSGINSPPGSQRAGSLHVVVEDTDPQEPDCLTDVPKAVHDPIVKPDVALHDE
jgi:hypothetical protein